MRFYTLEFVLCFTGLFLLWWLLPQRTRPYLLALANLFFAAALGGKALAALVCITLLGYLFGRLQARPHSPAAGRAVLGVGVAALLTPLALYKYLPVLAGYFAWATPFSTLLAPLGISFYTFKSIAYLVGVQRDSATMVASPVDYFAYIGFFPQLPMGPIQRPQPFFTALHALPRHLDPTLAVHSATRLLWAIFLKKCLADPFQSHLDALVHPSRYYPLAMLWAFGAYCLYLYFDFASYSHLAIGMGELLGLPCSENFKSPYFARSLSEFWRRWHISLSSLLRDFIYIPLGGSRNGTAVLILSTMATFILSGVWHGATDGFLLWGALHGIWLLIGRATKPAREAFWAKTPALVQGPVRSLLGWGFTLLLVFTGWFFFYAGTLPHAMEMLEQFQLPAALSLQYIKDSIVQIGFAPPVLLRMGLFTLLAALVDWQSRDSGFGPWNAKLSPLPRLALCYFCLFAVIFFGASGSLPGIYFAF